MISVYNTTGSDSGSSVYIGTKASDDTWLSDVRFTASDGTTLIDIWNETYYADHGDIWIECPTIDDSAGWDGYLYYGKSGASVVWNGTNTFPLLFDHFEGTSLDTGKWTFTGTPSISNSIVNLSSNGDRIQTILLGNIPTNTSLIFRSSTPTTMYYAGYYNSSATMYSLFYRLSDAGTYSAYSRYSGSESGTVITYTPGYCKYELQRNGTYSLNYYTSNLLLTQKTTNVPIGTEGLRFIKLSATAGNILIDYVFVRSYQYPEPAVSTWGAEEAADPIAAFSGTPTSGANPLTVSFTDASTAGGGGGLTVTVWSWTFGDGGTSTAQNPSHTYTTSGTYTVNLTVTNSAGNQDLESKTNYITVTTPGAPTADFSGAPTSGDAPLEVSFTDESTGSPTSWNWSFGDGEYSTWQHPIHTYTISGVYNVSLNATNAFGSDTHTIVTYITVTAPTTPVPTPTGTIPVQEPIAKTHIPPIGFVVLSFIDIGAMIYTFADNENRNGLHIVAAFSSVILSFLLALLLTNGFIAEAALVPVAEVSVNNSTMSVYEARTAPIIDMGFGYWFMFIGIVMLIIAILASLEVIREARVVKEIF
jgi:PKD repeat protein